MGAFNGRLVAVTGADGFIGSRMCRRLEALGASVRRITGPGSDADLALDLVRDSQALARALSGCDRVIHLAAASGGVRFQGAPDSAVLAGNLAITRNVLEAAQVGVDKTFIASSAVVYAADAGDPVVEDSPLVRPAEASPYAWGKLSDEAIASWAVARGQNVSIGRFTNVFGPGAPFGGARETVVHSLVRKAVEAGPRGRIEVWGDGSAVRSFIFVDDCVDAILHILESGEPGQPVNVSATGPVSIRQLAEAVRDVCQPSAELVFDTQAPVGVPRRSLDTRRLQSLGFVPATSLEEGLRRVHAAFIERR